MIGDFWLFPTVFVVTGSEVGELTAFGNRAVVFLFPIQRHVHEDRLNRTARSGHVHIRQLHCIWLKKYFKLGFTSIYTILAKIDVW